MTDQPTLSIGCSSFMESLPEHALASGRVRYCLHESVRTFQSAADLVPAGLTLEYRVDMGACSRTWWDGPQGCLEMYTGDGYAQLTILTGDEGTARQLLAEIEARATDPEAGQKFVRLWHAGGRYGPEKNRQRLDTGAWENIRSNYPTHLRRELQALMASGPPNHSGRLLLWHGEPGTGKTRACLALIDAWYPWSVPHVITDPERLFHDPSYLASVMDFKVIQTQEIERPGESLPQWNLIVCEDADEYLRVDARDRSGPSLGRLLNATDGILGQLSRCLVLLTTNDDVGRLHPAITRPGRCLSNLEFPRFTRDEAASWLGNSLELDAVTLAELYALQRGDSVAAQRALTAGTYL